MAEFGHWLAQLYSHLSYVNIFLLMTMEASLFPVPAEVVIIPAGYLAKQGQLDPVLCVLSATLGSLAGASINYLIGRYIGRVFLLKYGRYFGVREHHYHKAEKLFLKNSILATFIGRLFPIIRHVISLPAGVFGMGPVVFALATTAGAGVLCAFGVALGYYYGDAALEIMNRHMIEFVVICVAAVVSYAIIMALRRPRAGAT